MEGELVDDVPCGFQVAVGDGLEARAFLESAQSGI